MYKYAILAVCGVVSCAWSATVSQTREETRDIIRVENKFMVVKIAGGQGAKIRSWVDKSTGKELVWWQKDGHYSGLLVDGWDHGSKPYPLTIEESGPGRIVLRFVGPQDPRMRLVKRFTIEEDSPAIRVDYTYTNPGSERLHIQHMVDNRFLAGGSAGPEDVYFWRGPRGVEQKPYPYAQPEEYHEVEKPWYAVLDSLTKTGGGFVVDSPALSRFYNWADNSPPNPGVAWVLDVDLAPGGQLKVPVTLGLIHGLDGVTDASGSGVVQLVPTSAGNTLTVEGRFYPLVPLGGDRSAEMFCRYETLDRVFLLEEYGIRFSACEPGKVARGRTVFNAPRPGTHILTVEIHHNSRKLNQFEIPVVIGTSTGDYYKGKREKENARPLVTLTDKDLARGYVLHWGGAKPPFPAAGDLELTLGADEYESLELNVLALKNMGTVTAAADAGVAPDPDALQIQVQEGVVPDARLAYPQQYALAKTSQCKLPAGARKSFWLTINTRKLKPGDYSIRLKIHPELAPERILGLLVHVLKATRAPEADASLRMYHTMFYNSCFGVSLKDHCELMTSHYVRHLMFFPTYKQWDDLVSVRRDKAGGLEIDYRPLDEKLKEARGYGMDEIGLMYSPYNPQWLKALAAEPQKARDEAGREFARRFVDHLYALGFKEVWIYALDEPSLDAATDPKTIEYLRGLKRIHPRLKPHITINHYSPEMIRKLAKVIDVWMPTLSSICETMVNDQASGKIRLKAGDRLGFYAMTFYTQSYDDAQVYGWQAARLGIKQYTTFAYSQLNRPEMPWRIYAADPKGKVVSTPVFEGLRDGFEDFGYWQKLRVLLGRVDRVEPAKWSSRDKEAIDRARQFERNAFSLHSDALLVLKRVPGGHGGRSWHTFEADRWDFLKVKALLLKHIVALQTCLEKNHIDTR